MGEDFKGRAQEIAALGLNATGRGKKRKKRTRTKWEREPRHDRLRKEKREKRKKKLSAATRGGKFNNPNTKKKKNTEGQETNLNSRYSHPRCK